MKYFVVKIKETYTYNALVNAESIEDVDSIINNEVSLLVDKDKNDITEIRDTKFGLQGCTQLEIIEIDKDVIPFIEDSYVNYMDEE